MQNIYDNARKFLYRNARPLDMARFQFHFEGGSHDAVMNALAAYQNEDGGFGHALEPDSWNPNSSPIQTWTATEILREIGYADAGHPIIQGMLRYLASGKNFDGNLWYNVIPSNNDYPHAPWWRTDSGSACNSDYNPTACLAGFILRHAERGNALFKLGWRVAGEACAAYLSGGLLGDMHTSACYVRLIEYVEEAGITDAFDLASIKKKLREQVRRGITQDTSQWETGYICRPSHFMMSARSPFYEDNKDVSDYECGFIAKTQLDDGSWPIPWSWTAYPAEWAVSKNWWKGNGALLNLLYLRGMDQL